MTLHFLLAALYHQVLLWRHRLPAPIQNETAQVWTQDQSPVAIHVSEHSHFKFKLIIELNHQGHLGISFFSNILQPYVTSLSLNFSPTSSLSLSFSLSDTVQLCGFRLQPLEPSSGHPSPWPRCGIGRPPGTGRPLVPGAPGGPPAHHAPLCD